MISTTLISQAHVSGHSHKFRTRYLALYNVDQEGPKVGNSCVGREIHAGGDQQTHDAAGSRRLRVGDLSLTERFREVKHLQVQPAGKPPYDSQPPLSAVYTILLSAQAGALKHD